MFVLLEYLVYFNSEIILTCLWGILVIGGIIVQLLLTRKRQKFPDSLYKRFKRWNSRRENNSINSRNNIRRAQESFHSSTTSGMENDERRRLLSFDSIPVSNYATITSNDVIKWWIEDYYLFIPRVHNIMYFWLY